MTSFAEPSTKAPPRPATADPTTAPAELISAPVEDARQIPLSEFEPPDDFEPPVDDPQGNRSYGRPPSVAVMLLSGSDKYLNDPTTAAAQSSVTEAALSRVAPLLGDGDTATSDDQGRIILSMQAGNTRDRVARLNSMTREIAGTPMSAEHGDTHVDVGAGFVGANESSAGGKSVHTASRRALEALESRDLMVRSDLSIHGRKPMVRRDVTGYQVFLALFLSLVVPFLLMVAGYNVGIDVSGTLYLVLVIALGTMVLMQWAEALRALKPPRLPAASGRPLPRASAIIAAYLPNEADTIVETLHAFLAQEYEGGLQVIVAYNTPKPLPIEDELREMTKVYPNLLLLKVEGSSSKAQNVNAALASVEGEFVGIFDADHHPMAGAFDRAWRWIDSGVDVVQGHCVIRNGDDSAVARLVAVEFEQIYAVSHPGRQYLHGFGVFGGSNGFWRTRVLRETRLRTRYLTEDIESSIRAIRDGHRIVNDPGLISRELAPETARQLWKQRMRWAQGWFQVSLLHGHSAVFDRDLKLNQRFGLLFLLGWREVYPWLSSMMWPLLAFFLWRDGTLVFTSPVWLLTTIFTLSCGPIQAMFAYKLGVPEIRRHKRWFAAYVVSTVLFYQEAKNLIARVAQIKQFMGERHWAVTPRSATTRATPEATTVTVIPTPAVLAGEAV
jgi:cellulose synthase/poly-beta-1,6-N-acetylglucosamine synthase-like glycosyltransferase